MKNKLNGAEALVLMLESHGVSHVFGLCGDTSLPFYDALRNMQHGIEHILTRDERTAAYMADGYARVTSRVGVCEGPSGGGATYILPGLIEANESSSAMVAITSDISVASYGKYPLTEVDQESLMRPLTKWNSVVRRADHIPRMVRAAFRAATSGRPGAAHLGIPYDIQYDQVDSDDLWSDSRHKQFPASPAAPEPGLAEQALDSIFAAKRPLIVCGGGVVIAGATDELDRLVVRLDIPVATSISGQGSLSDYHPNCLGVVGSNGGTDETWELMQSADLIAFLGCRAGSTTTARWECPSGNARVIQIDSDPMVVGANYAVDTGIVADLRLALAEMNRILDDYPGHAAGFSGAARVKDCRDRKFRRFHGLAKANGKGPIRPEQVVHALQSSLPDDSTIVADPGTPCPYLSAYYRSRLPGRRFITNRAHGALGYSLGAAIGAWFGRPNSRTVAVMGDGSFGFTAGELETIARLDVPLLIVVLSNSSFGWIKASQKADFGGRYHNVDFDCTDHAAVASAYLKHTFRVTEQDKLLDTIKAAAGLDAPALVDIVCQPLEESQAPVRKWMG